MRRSVFVCVAALIFGGLAGPAGAGKATGQTFFLHGGGPVQEAFLNEMWLDSAWMTMDGEEPEGAEFSSMFVTNYFRGPNTDCDGNGLLPVWRGDFSGKFKGDVVVTLHTVATPVVDMTVSLYPDPSGTCTAEPPIGNSQAPKPVATETITVAPGHAATEVTFKKVKFKAAAGLLLQLSIPTQTTPGQVRILFDSADFASNVELKPKK